jgi:hypothetical protein
VPTVDALKIQVPNFYTALDAPLTAMLNCVSMRPGCPTNGARQQVEAAINTLSGAWDGMYDQFNQFKTSTQQFYNDVASMSSEFKRFIGDVVELKNQYGFTINIPTNYDLPSFSFPTLPTKTWQSVTDQVHAGGEQEERCRCPAV